MRNLFIVGRELSYQRNDVLLRALKRLGAVDIVAPGKKPKSLIFTSLILGFRALKPLLFGNYDLVFVGFYGYLLMLEVGIIAHWRKIPILFDAFVSNYDTLVADRQAINTESLSAKLAMWLDRTTCQLADHILLDTQQHVDYFSQAFNLPLGKISSLPVSCNEDIFSPQKAQQQVAVSTTVLYYCTYQPLHGAHVVIEAANLLKEEKISFHLIGTGQEYPRVRNLVEKYHLNNIQFAPFVPLEILRDEINRADICLGGHFGASAKAARVVPGKLYQMLAMRRPVIAADTEANRAFLINGESALLIQPDNAVMLADAIRQLHADPKFRKRIAENGANVYRSCCSESVITAKMKIILSKLL